MSCWYYLNRLILLMLKSFFMIRTLAVFLAICILFNACKKSSSDSGTTTVECQITATNSSGIAISYNNVLEQKVLVNAQNSWSFDVIVDQKPFHITSVCTVNIL